MKLCPIGIEVSPFNFRQPQKVMEASIPKLLFHSNGTNKFSFKNGCNRCRVRMGRLNDRTTREICDKETTMLQ